MERKLATIQIINSIEPIKDADMIEKATILGWEVVIAKKDNFKVGDKVIYIEVDSVMPEKPEYEFLRPRKFRVRTIKLKGQVSQGLVLPLNVLDSVKCDVGDDVTEKLGITKYLTPSEQTELQQQEDKIKFEKNKLKKFMMRYSWFRKLFLSKKQKSGFPYWCAKTDEERVQNIPQILAQFADKEVYVTEKIDYQSGTWTSKSVPKFNGFIGKLFPVNKTLFVVASRNLVNNDKNSLYWQIAKQYNLEQVCKDNVGIVIQGEQGSTGVQGNKYGIKEPKMWVFNVIDSKTNYHYNRKEMEQFCNKYNLNIVPLLRVCKLSELGTTVQEIVEQSKGKSLENPNMHREGIVIRCIENGKKILSFKAINPDFLLKYED